MAKTALEKSRRVARVRKLRDDGSSRKLIEAAKKNPKQQSVLSVFEAQKRKVQGTDSLPSGSGIPSSKLRKSTVLGKAYSSAGSNQPSILTMVDRGRRSHSHDGVSKDVTQIVQVDQETLKSSSSSVQSEALTTKPRRSERLPRQNLVYLEPSSDEEMSVDDVDSQPTSETDTSRQMGGSEESEGTHAPVPSSSSTQPDDEENEPECTFDKIRQGLFNTTQEQVLSDIEKKRSNHEHVLRTRFGQDACRRVSNLFTMAVYNHADQGAVMQGRQVFALLFHLLDHQWTTVLQREHYHRFCGSWCSYRK